VTLGLVLTGCSPASDGAAAGRARTAGVTSTSSAAPARSDPPLAGLPGMPPVLDPNDVYAATRPGRLSPVVRRIPARVYVPDGGGDTVDVINARTLRRIGRFAVGRQPQHVTPSWDLRTLWAGNNQGNSLTAIDPVTGRPGRTVRVADPYNLYFTPNGRHAIVVAERLRRLDFRDVVGRGVLSTPRPIVPPCSSTGTVLIPHEVVVHGVLQRQLRRDPQQVTGHHVLGLHAAEQIPQLEVLVGGPGGLDQEPADERDPDAPGEVAAQQEGQPAATSSQPNPLAGEAIRVARPKLPVAFQMAERSSRPPSSGNPGPSERGQQQVHPAEVAEHARCGGSGGCRASSGRSVECVTSWSR
jgi:hypothetical protein